MASLTVAAQASPPTVPEPGGSWSVLVTISNTSADAAILTSLSDDVSGNLDGTGDCSTGALIAAGSSYACSYDLTVTGTSGVSESRTVTALLTDDLDGTTATESSTVTVVVTDLPASGTIAQDVTPDGFDEPGGDATFTVRVDNTGTVDALTVQSLVHDLAGDIDGQGSCALPQAIAAGSFYECSFTIAVSGSSGDVLSPVVTGTGADSDGSPWGASSNAVSITFDDVPSAMSVDKSANPAEVPEPGADVVFSVTVTNDSTADAITLDSLVDDVHGDLDGQGDCSVPQDIAVGGSYGCSFSATVSGNAGDTETDTITAAATDDDGAPLQETGSATVAITDVPSSLSVTKAADPTEISEPGENVVFSVSIENTSVVDTVTLEALTDVPFGDVTQVQGNIVATDCTVTQSLLPGQTYDCSFTAFVAGNAGDTVTDTVTVDGTDDDGEPVSGGDSADVDVLDAPPTMVVSKTAVPLEVPEPGAASTFTVSVTNTSAEPITITSVGDDVYGNLAGACGIPATVQPGATFECSFTRTVQGDAGDRRTDIVTITAQDDEGNRVTEQDDATVTITDVLPALEIDKSANPETLPEPGGTALFRVAITDPSVENVEITSLVDDIHGDLDGQGTCQTPTTVTANGGT